MLEEQTLASEISDRVKLVRSHFGLSQRAMADKISCHYVTWQAYEAGKSVPGGEILSELVKLGIDANWLLTGEGEMEKDSFKNSTPVDMKLLENIIEMIERHLKNAYFFEREMDPDKKAQLVCMIYDECMEKEEINEDKVIKLLKLAS